MNDRAKPLFAANWKMFKGPSETEEFVSQFSALYPARSDRRVAFFPPAISLEAFVRAAGLRPDLECGIQDVHEEVEGVGRGEAEGRVSAPPSAIP
jgi:triosephosphate isomerase